MRLCWSLRTAASSRAHASRSSHHSTARGWSRLPLDDHVLDSITRRRLIESGLVSERPIAADELPFASEAFLASTLREVHAVHSIDGVALPAAPGPLTQRAAKAVHEVIAAAVLKRAA